MPNSTPTVLLESSLNSSFKYLDNIFDFPTHVSPMIIILYNKSYPFASSSAIL